MSALNKNPLIMSFIVLGSVIGYLIGVASKCPIQILILATINGTFFGYLLGTALYWKKYETLMWGVVATFISFICKRIHFWNVLWEYVYGSVWVSSCNSRPRIIETT